MPSAAAANSPHLPPRPPALVSKPGHPPVLLLAERED